MKSFLILGGNSTLAKAFYRLNPRSSQLVTKKECDITSENDLELVIGTFLGKYVLNTAAITDIEVCEKDPQRCFQVNTSSLYSLNKICKKYSKKLIHISSDYAAYPINAYGQSKKLSEFLLDSDFLTIRTNFYSHKSYIIRKLLNLERLKAYSNVYFNPVSIYSLILEIKHSMSKKGTINILSESKISYLDFAYTFCEIFGISKKLVNSGKFQQSPQAAQRPLSSYLESDVWINLEQDLLEFKNYLLVSK